MQKATLEKNIAFVLFVLVLVVFSFAQRDSKKLDNLYHGDRYSLNPPAPRLEASMATTPVAIPLVVK